MKKLALKFFSNKKLAITAISFLVIIAAISVYMLVSVYNNVGKMTALNEAEPYFPDYPAAKTEGKNADLIKHGEYLVKAGDCIACHTNTPEKGKPFAGGLPMVTPFGTIYSPNITPDKKTGIGNWSDEQFIKAMRQGINPRGHYYFPAFPFLYFSKIKTDDLKAMKAYLDSIPAVQQKNRKHEMVFPFNWRFLQLGWRLIFFKTGDTGEFQPDPHKTEQWNRGAYLAEGLGHCAMCHSPSYKLISNALPLGAPIRKFDLTGAKVQGYLAPNITSSNLSKISNDEIIEVFTKDRLIGGGKVEGPMLEVNHDSLRYLSQEDLVAVAVYLREVQSQTPPKPKGGAGRGIYEEYCSGCHASGAGGAPKMGDAIDWEPVLKDGIEKVYVNAINGINGMPAKGTCISCSDAEIKETVNYMVAPVIEKVKNIVIIPKAKPLTIEDGKRIYEENCAVCHNVGFKNAPKPGDVEAWKPVVDAGFIKTFENVMTGHKGHIPRGACPTCSDQEIKAAVKYMLQESAPGKDFSLW